MYKIIGADQKEYGPVTSDQIRQWIAQGRVNGRTQARAEDAQDWVPLSSIPEFADALGGGGAPPTEAPVPPPAGDGREKALRRVKAPALALAILACLDIIGAVWGLLRTAIFPPNAQQYDSQLQQLHNALQQLNNPQLQEMIQKLIDFTQNRPIGIASGLFGLAMSVLILMGALKMQSLRSYEFSITAAIISMVPCVTPCCSCVLGLPFGIWALIVLRAPEVKSQFR